APVEPGPGPVAGAPHGGAAEEAARVAGPRAPGPAALVAGGRAAHDARVAPDRRRAARPEVPPAPAAPPRAVRAVRRLHQRHERERVLPVRAARSPRPVPEAALVRVRGADLRGDRRVRARALI